MLTYKKKTLEMFFINLVMSVTLAHAPFSLSYKKGVEFTRKDQCKIFKKSFYQSFTNYLKNQIKICVYCRTKNLIPNFN